jgi:hypothetical protein
VRARAPFVRGRLVARRRPQRCQEVVVWISIPFDRIRGLGASPGGIPTTTFSFGLEYVLGCLESVARALGHVRAHPGSSLTLLLEGSCRTLFEGQLSLPRDLLRASGPFSTYLGIFVRGSLPRSLAGRVFWGGEIGAVVGDVACGHDVGDGHVPDSCEM